MGILNTVLKVVGVVGAVMTGGLLAGAVIALASFAGGSVGKFFQSGWGKALTYAVAAGSAYAGLSAGGAAAAAESNTTSGFLDSFVGGAKSFVSALAHPIDTAESLFGAGSTADLSATAGSTTLTANASEAAASATADTASAVGEGAGSAAGAAAADTPINELAQGAASSSPADSAIAAEAGQTAPAAGSPAAAQAAVSPADEAVAAEAGGGSSTTATSAPGAVDANNQLAAESNSGLYAGKSSSNGGMLSKAMDFAKSPGGGKILGSVVQGLGQGMFQNSQMDKMIQAQNWANLQWRNPQLTQQVQAAAAQPITVPSGYLSRANAVAGMMNGQPQTGPIIGPQPSVSNTGGPGPGGVGTPLQPIRAGGT